MYWYDMEMKFLLIYWENINKNLLKIKLLEYWIDLVRFYLSGYFFIWIEIVIIKIFVRKLRVEGKFNYGGYCNSFKIIVLRFFYVGFSIIVFFYCYIYVIVIYLVFW